MWSPLESACRPSSRSAVGTRVRRWSWLSDRGATVRSIKPVLRKTADRGAPMPGVILFHHAHGLTDGAREFADQLRAAGRHVTVVAQRSAGADRHWPVASGVRVRGRTAGVGVAAFGVHPGPHHGPLLRGAAGLFDSPRRAAERDRAGQRRRRRRIPAAVRGSRSATDTRARRPSSFPRTPARLPLRGSSDVRHWAHGDIAAEVNVYAELSEHRGLRQ